MGNSELEGTAVPEARYPGVLCPFGRAKGTLMETRSVPGSLARTVCTGFSKETALSLVSIRVCIDIGPVYWDMFVDGPFPNALHAVCADSAAVFHDKFLCMQIDQPLRDT